MKTKTERKLHIYSDNNYIEKIKGNTQILYWIPSQKSTFHAK